MMTKQLAWALVVSMAAHLAVMLPAQWWLPRKHVSPRPLLPLTVQPPLPVNLARELATQPEMPDPPQAAVPPAPTLQSAEKPRELKGRALDTALAALAREELYPREAVERGWEGRVVLLLLLDPGGRVTDIEIASPSGHAVLDHAAIRAATRITALPGGRRQVLLPVEFRLE